MVVTIAGGMTFVSPRKELTGREAETEFHSRVYGRTLGKPFPRLGMRIKMSDATRQHYSLATGKGLQGSASGPSTRATYAGGGSVQKGVPDVKTNGHKPNPKMGKR